MATYTQAYDEREPLSEEGTMSFLDHLDELRKRLIRSALFIAAAFVICWIFSAQIYNFLQVPVLAAMREARRAFVPEINGTPLVLSDLPDGTDVIFTLPTDAKLGAVLIGGEPPSQPKSSGTRTAR